MTKTVKDVRSPQFPPLFNRCENNFHAFGNGSDETELISAPPATTHRLMNPFMPRPGSAIEMSVQFSLGENTHNGGKDNEVFLS